MAFLTGCSRSPSTAYAVPLAPAPSRAGAFCLERRLRPGIGAQNGTRFPVGASNGKRIPEFGSRVGCVFRLKPQAETASRNSVSERDELSQRGRMRKLCPGIMPQNGMRFPLAGRLESASQFECLFRDAVSAEGLNRKACPALRRDSGTRFPPGPPSGKCIPF